MAKLEFNKSDRLGSVREVDTRKVSVLVENDEDLRKARVGQLVAIDLSGASDYWLIAIIEKVIRFVGQQDNEEESENKLTEEINEETVVNNVKVTLVGTFGWNAAESKSTFTRSIAQVPGITDECFVLRGKSLETFMSVLSETSQDKEYSLELGNYFWIIRQKPFLMGINFSRGTQQYWEVRAQVNLGRLHQF